MDPPPAFTADHIPPLPTSKVRLMCSYGGHIVPRPHDKALFYAGGDTRIVSVDRRTTASSLSCLTSHLSRTLYNNRPFKLKYQLPDEELDSLISVTTDEDLHNMLEEHDRIVSSPRPSRLRLFLFSVKPDSVGSVLLDPKSESWFCDALKNTKIIQRGQSTDSGLGHGLVDLDCAGASDSSMEAQLENGGGESKQGLEPESMVLETSSSFGSTSSSISMTNLPPIGVNGEDVVLNLLDKRTKMASPGSFESDTSVGSAISHPKTGIYQEPPLIHLPSSGVSSNTSEPEINSSDSSPPMIQMQRTLHHVSGYQLPQNQQEVQYIPAPAPLPVSSRSYYPSSQHNPHLMNHQLYPVYLVPFRPTQSYNMSMQSSNHVENPSHALSRPPLHPNTEGPAKVYATLNGAMPLVSGGSNDSNQQQLVDRESHDLMGFSDCGNEFDVDIAYSPLYKTQPPAPSLPSESSTVAVHP